MAVGQDTTKLRRPRVLLGEIISVDEENFVCDVARDLDDGIISGVPMLTAYLNAGEGMSGQGIYVMPEVGSRVYLLYPSDSEFPVILGFAPLPEAGDDEGDDEDAEKEMGYRNNRPTMSQGDIILMSKDGAHVVLRRSGVLEIGSTSACKRYYFPLTNLIREFAESYELHTTGGTFRLANDRDPNPQLDTDAVDGSERVPGLLQLLVRQYTDDIPVVRLEAGYIEEEETSKLSSLRSAKAGRIVYRLSIGSSDDPRLSLEDRGAELSDNYVHRVDMDGRSEIRTDKSYEIIADEYYSLTVNRGSYGLKAQMKDEDIGGTSLEAVDGIKRTYVDKGMHTRVGGGGEQGVQAAPPDTSQFVQNRGFKSSPKHTLVVEGGSTQLFAGNLAVEASSTQTVVTGSAKMNYASRELGISGASVYTVAGPENKGVSGYYNMQVSNGDIEHIGEGYLVRLETGAMVFANADESTGAVRMLAGVPAASVPGAAQLLSAKTGIEFTGSGQVQLQWGSTIGLLLGTDDGAIEIGNLLGTVLVSTDGQVQLGATGPAGAVITTMSHPVCFVTGSPIQGVNDVTAGGTPTYGPGPAAVKTSLTAVTSSS